MNRKSLLIEEIQLRLKAPLIVLEKITGRRYLPKIFANAALDELIGIQKLINKLEKKGRK